MCNLNTLNRIVKICAQIELTEFVYTFSLSLVSELEESNYDDKRVGGTGEFRNEVKYLSLYTKSREQNS